MRVKITTTTFAAILAMAAVFGIGGTAAAVETPATAPGVETVDTDKVVSLMAGGVAVYDVRTASIYAEGHIKGSINVPYREKSAKEPGFNPAEDEFNLKALPAQKDKPFIMYCDGKECWKSYKASIVAAKGGHKKIYWYRGGYPDWSARNMPIEK